MVGICKLLQVILFCAIVILLTNKKHNMIKECVVCKKEFYIRPCDFKLNKYSCCSRVCSFKNPNRKTPKEESHFAWKGNKAGYHSIHYFVRLRKKKPKKCEICGKKTDYLDLANKSQEYKRDLDDWQYLCRLCHMTIDGRLKVLTKK